MKAARIADLISHPTSDLIKDGVFVLGTRTSKLAMVQTELVKRELERIWPGREIRISGMVCLLFLLIRSLVYVHPMKRTTVY